MIFNPVYGGSSAPNLGEKTIVANGEYNASSDNLDGYSKVIANVPNTYAASDEGKVVDNGALVSQTSATYTANDTYDTTLIDSVTVNVSGGGSVSPFVESQATAYFNTGVAGNTVYGLYFEFEPITAVNNWQWYIGGANNNLTIASMATSAGITSGFIRCGNVDFGVVTFLQGRKNIVECLNGKVTLNGTELSGTYSGAVNTSSTSIKILGGDVLSHSRVYKCIFYDVNGNKIHEYVPREDSNYIPCLYDTIASNYLYGTNNRLTYGDGSYLIEKAITANGTYDASDDNADGYSSVTVDAQGGGVQVIARSDWEALTTAQKQAYGLVAIQDADSGFDRGELVCGADYVPTPVIEYFASVKVNSVNEHTYTFAASGIYQVLVVCVSGDTNSKTGFEFKYNGTTETGNYSYPSTNNNVRMNLWTFEFTAAVGDMFSVKNTSTYGNAGYHLFVLSDAVLANIDLYDSRGNQNTTFAINLTTYYLQVAKFGFYSGNNTIPTYEIDNTAKTSTATPNQNAYWYGGTYVLTLQ